MRIAQSLILVLAGIFLIPLGGPVLATDYPLPTDSYVNDFAHVLDSGSSQQLKTELQQFQSRKGIQIVIVTVNSINDYSTGDPSIESFSKNLFNTWGVGNKVSNNGVMMVAAIQDKKVRVTLGSGYGPEYEAKMQKVIDQSILPAFKTQDYSGGILHGANDIMNSVSNNLFANPWNIVIVGSVVVLLIALIAIGISLIRSGKKGLGWTLLVIAAGIILFIISGGGQRSRKSGFGGGSSSGGGATGSW